MQSFRDFFSFFQKENQFDFNKDADPYKEFIRLIVFMNWNAEAIAKNSAQFYFCLNFMTPLAKPEKQIVFPNTNEFTKPEYFSPYKENFNLNSKNAPELEIEKVAEEMHSVGKENYLGEKLKLQQSLLENSANNLKMNEIKQSNEKTNLLKKTKKKERKENKERKKEKKKKPNEPKTFLQKPEIIEKIENTITSIPEKKNQINPLEIPMPEQPILIPEDYFYYYEIHHNYLYGRQNSHKEEFEKLASFMNWKEDSYSKNRRKFTKILYGYQKKSENYEENIKKFEEAKISKKKPKEKLQNEEVLSPKDYFEYYQKYHQFLYDKYNSAKREFVRLAQFMDWKEEFFEKNFKKFTKILHRYIPKSACEEKNNKYMLLSKSERKKKDLLETEAFEEKNDKFMIISKSESKKKDVLPKDPKEECEEKDDKFMVTPKSERKKKDVLLKEAPQSERKKKVLLFKETCEEENNKFMILSKDERKLKHELQKTTKVVAS